MPLNDSTDATKDGTDVVEQAKKLLIEREHIGENEAHRYIQKRARDLRMTKRKCALEVIRKYRS